MKKHLSSPILPNFFPALSGQNFIDEGDCLTVDFGSGIDTAEIDHRPVRVLRPSRLGYHEHGASPARRLGGLQLFERFPFFKGPLLKTPTCHHDKVWAFGTLVLTHF